MPSRKKRLLKGALLGAAATALTVKGALAGSLGAAAKEPLDEIQKGLRHTADAAVTTSLTLAASAAAHTGGTSQAMSNSSAQGPRAPARISKAKAANSATTSAADYPELRPDGALSRSLIKKTLREAALRHGVEPKLVLALSYWESGWDQSKVSETGAVGLMQVEPDSANEAGPALLGRTVDINDPYDNADVGAAIFRENLDHFKDPAMALAAYYQGPTSLVQDGMLPDTQQYVDGILSLAARLPS